MCCETCSLAESDGGAATKPALADAQFCASLHEGMHAMAQPLTLLQSYFYLAHTGAGDSPRSRELGADAAAGVERLCLMFRLMQEIVHVHSAAATVARTPFPLVLASLEEDAEIVFAGTGCRLDLQLIARPGPRSGGRAGGGREQQALALPLLVKADLKRTRHALQSMLHLARESSESGSVITCGVAASPGRIEVNLSPEKPLAGLVQDHFDEGARLHLALAKANILSQNGCFRLIVEPFALAMQLPVVSEQA